MIAIAPLPPVPADTSHDLLHRAQELGHEARVRLDDHASLKLWLRLLACTTQIETEIRQRLRRRFGISLARFDYMSQLYRHRAGLKMKALSRCLMVTGGNVTGLTDELERDELVVREQDPADRRSSLVRLTPKGRRAFESMAKEHEIWILEMLGSLDADAVQQLYHALGRLRVQMVGNSA
jgi:DNA-binding MarR family transcriptional regulator